MVIILAIMNMYGSSWPFFDVLWIFGDSSTEFLSSTWIPMRFFSSNFSAWSIYLVFPVRLKDYTIYHIFTIPDIYIYHIPYIIYLWIKKNIPTMGVTELALSGWAWNFVSFLGISCSDHSGTFFSLGVSACSWRSNPFSSLASSSLHWALELQTPIA